MFLKLLIISISFALVSSNQSSFQKLLADIKNNKLDHVRIYGIEVGASVGEDLMKALKISKASSLEFYKCKIWEEGGAIISENIKSTKIKQLSLTSINIISIKTVVGIIRSLKNSQIEILSLIDMPYGNLLTQEVAEILESSNIIALIMTHNNIEENGAFRLAKSLNNKSKLIKLDLSHNNMKSSAKRLVMQAAMKSPIRDLNTS